MQITESERRPFIPTFDTYLLSARVSINSIIYRYPWFCRREIGDSIIIRCTIRTEVILRYLFSLIIQETKVAYL